MPWLVAREKSFEIFELCWLEEGGRDEKIWDTKLREIRRKEANYSQPEKKNWLEKYMVLLAAQAPNVD